MGVLLGMIMHSIERLYNCRVGGDLQASFKSKLFLMKLPKDGRVGGVFCDFDEYTVDIPENRLIKKALLFSSHILRTITQNHSIGNKAKLMLSKSLALFENVSDEVRVKEVSLIKGHKLFSEYNEAVRLAKLILRRYDYSISKTSYLDENVPPFTLNMSLLYEHYVYGLLNEAYGDKISYQFKGKTGSPDFLYCATGFRAILDTKYIPKYESSSLDNNVIRQLSGYSRDIPILRHLGYEDINEESPIPNVPCIIIYPKEGNLVRNPFMKKNLRDLCTTPVRKLVRFYKICIPLPVMGSNK